MLSPKTQMNLKNAKEYFREHLGMGDYYAQGQQVRGVWFGAGAEKLGLKGVTSEQAFVRLCEGLHPETGERLTLRRNTDRRENGQRVVNRRVLFDFTISPPKSVSVVALLQDGPVIGAHDRAVQVAMAELERFARTRVRKGGKEETRITGNVLGAAFRHETSRELDPHLHTHCIVFNATFDPVERRWKALEPALMLRAQKFVENCYYHELCRGLKKLGYEIEANRRDFEIKGVPASVTERFSKRHRQIDAEAARRTERGEPLGNVKDAREQIARASRKRKPEATSPERFLSEWQRQLLPAERKALTALRDKSGSSAPSMSAAELVDWANEHLFERRAVVDDFDLLSAALARGRGASVDVDALRAEIARRDYVREVDSTKLTSRDVLRCELALVFATREGRGSHAPMAADHKPSARLSDEQTAAVRQILGSRDFITVFRGGAGTGKSFALREVKRGIECAGRPVVVVAPQRQQVTDLTADGLAAETVSHLLATKRLPSRAVVIVDEAGQIGARQMFELITLAKQNGARLLLSGDTRQHGAVSASDALRAIEAYGGIRPAEIQEIRRQDPSRGATASERIAIGRYRAAVKAAASGDVVTAFERIDRLGWIRELGEEARRAALAKDYVAAFARRETALVVGQTWDEVRGVNDAIRSQLRTSGRLKAGKVVASLRGIDATTAQKRDPGFYATGQSVCFVSRYGRFVPGDVCSIASSDVCGLTLIKNGRRSRVSYRYADRFTVVESVALEIAVGTPARLASNGLQKCLLPVGRQISGSDYE
jgi:conjugative relaxase-like TrwC/TraI family protein